MSPSDIAGMVLVTGTQLVPKEACDLIGRHGFKVRWIEDDSLDEARLHEELADAVGYLIGGDEKVLGEHFDRAANLEAVAWLGTDFKANVPGWEQAVKRGIALISTPGENAISVAEFTVLLILTMARPFIARANGGSTGGPGELPVDSARAIELNGKTLGIIGAGRIGARVARVATHGFGMEVLYAAPHRNEPLEAALGVTHVTLTDLLSNSDIISLHRPGPVGDEQPLLGREQLERIDRDTVLINTAHHGLVDPEALLWAIEQRGLRAAFDGVGDGEVWERLAALGPSRFLGLPQMGFRTEGANLRISLKAAEAVCQVLSGSESALVNNPDFREIRRR
jgi:D-3-phosphoglycerate dehydrogenase